MNIFPKLNSKRGYVLSLQRRYFIIVIFKALFEEYLSVFLSKTANMPMHIKLCILLKVFHKVYQ